MMVTKEKPMSKTSEPPYLATLAAVRSQAQRVLRIAEEGQLSCFNYDDTAIPNVVQYVQRTILTRSPNLDIPNHSRLNHFKVGNFNRIDLLKLPSSKIEQAKTLFECVFLSVLLDAGAGNVWRYRELSTNEIYTRSEGLGLASFYGFTEGHFSDKQSGYVTQASVEKLDLPTFESIFQITTNNPLIGVEERLKLIHRLAGILNNKAEIFGPEKRLGNFMSWVLSDCHDNTLSAETIFNKLMFAFSDLWEYGAILNDRRLGDVWHYSKIEQDYEASLIPFHKLTQWLCYSVIDMLESLNYVVTDQDKLTGLAEYRNGGLFIDAGVLTPKKQNDTLVAHSVNSDFIIEWRAMTIALLDIVAAEIRSNLQQNLSLSKILEGGTWWAGRNIAQEKRKSNEPPIKIRANGITF